MKKIIPALMLSAVTLGAILPAQSAMAQYYDRGPGWDHRGPGWDRRGPPPPPPRRRHNDGAVIAGGLAAGVIGGLIGGAIANSGPRYIDPPPPPPPRCWFEDRQVPNAYNGGWHYESMRICR